MSRILMQNSRTKHVSSTPSSPPPLYSFHPPRAGGGSQLSSSTTTPLPSPTSSLRLSAPLVFSTPPQSPPHNGSSSGGGSSFSFPRLHTNPALVPTPHESSLPFLSTVELSPPPEHYSTLPEEHEQDGAEHLASMGKKSLAAKKKGKAKAKTKAKGLSSTSTATPAPAAPATSVQWSERQPDAAKAPIYSTTAAYGGHKHKGKKHELQYAQDYEDELAAEDGYYDEHFELDERRGRSTRPRLLWRSQLDPLTLGVLDSHVVEVRGTKVPRLTGEGSVEGKKWSRELEKCGL